MIEGRTILCFASGYDAPPTSKHHVMRRLAERNVVLWVNYHASRVPSAGASDAAYIVAKLGQVAGGLRRAHPNLYVLTPLVVPLPTSRLARETNRILLVMQVRAALARVRQGPLQVWSFAPDVAYALDAFDAEAVVYYCVDDFASFSGYDRGQVLADEETLCRRADLVVTTSRALQDAKAPLNPNTILVPHGVDYAHFARAIEKDLPVPEDLADIPHPVLGFFGLIRDWVDLDLVAEVARRRPAWHVVLVGDSTVDLTPYRDLPNLHFVGRKPYEDLPAWCRRFDVGLIPFKINDLTEAVNPIKLREYLAAGLPVLSTPLPEVVACGFPVRVVEGPDGFVGACEAALAEGAGIEARRSRSAPMAEETWDRKVDRIADRLIAAASDQPARGAATRRRRVMVGVAGGGFVIQCKNLLRACPETVELLVTGPEHAVAQYDAWRDRWLSDDGSWFATRQLRSHGRLQSALAAALGSLRCLELVYEHRPDAVVAVGHRIAVFLLAAGRLLGTRTAFVECITRVRRPSRTGRIVSGLGLADRVFVQWPQTRRLYRRAVYGGRIL